jgi:hypothetical protein
VTFQQGAATLCGNVPLNAGGIATCATAALTAGSHTITAEYRQGSNFADSDGHLAGGQTVSKAPLTVTATDGSTTYGEAHPQFEVSYAGFVNNEGAGALGGTLTFSFAGKPPTSYGPSATVPVNAGTYAIRPGGLTSDNYEITFRGGTYIINRATPTVSVAGGPFTYDGSQHGAAVAATGVGGAPVGGSATTTYAGLPPLAYGPSPTEPVNAGTYTVLVQFTSSDPNYTDAQATGQIIIKRRPASVTPDNAGKIFGNPEPSPLTTGTLSGFVPADGVAATYGRTPGETVGPYTISATLSPASALDNYDVTYNTAVFTIGAWNAQGHGFYQPVGVSSSIFLAATGPAARVPSPSGQTVWSVARGGSAIPLKFNVYAGDVEKTSTSVVTFRAVKLPSCGADGDGEMPIDFVTTGNTSLRYDTLDRQFIQTWKTPSVSSETCYRATATFADGSTLSAFFKLRK